MAKENNMITKKRSAGILLCLVWIAVFTMLRPASADVTGTGTKDAPYEVSTWSDLNNLMDPYSPAANRCKSDKECYIKLNSNITPESGDKYLEVSRQANVILDLNGQTIDRGLKNADAVNEGYVIRVMGNLTLDDDSRGGGKITGGNNSSPQGGGIYVVSGSFTMNDGSITDNSAGENSFGGGVCIINHYFYHERRHDLR